MTLTTIDEPSRAPADSHAVLALGFRPFYLLAAAFAAISVPAWMAGYYGWSGATRIDLPWHVHEMVFGFGLAVIVGFLYTAGRNWTGLWTPRGRGLAAIAALWIAGRVAMLVCPPLLAAAIDFAFIPVAAWPLFRVLQRSGNRRNMFLIVLLALLATANGLFHAALLGAIALDPLRPVYAGLMVIVLIETVIGGRVIPMFTNNGVPGTRTVTDPRADKVALAFTAGAALAWVLAWPAALAASLAVGAAAAQARRLTLWKPLATLRAPLVWILHLSYAWIALGFALLALAEVGLAPRSAAVHVLAVGAVGGLIMGMITRTALGHTGRVLKAGKAETAMYWMIGAAVVCRLAAALTTGMLRETCMLAAAACWSGSFALYLVVYGPRLTAPRIDGKEG